MCGSENDQIQGNPDISFSKLNRARFVIPSQMNPAVDRGPSLSDEAANFGSFLHLTHSIASNSL